MTRVTVPREQNSGLDCNGWWWTAKDSAAEMYTDAASRSLVTRASLLAASNLYAITAVLVKRANLHSSV